jgi:hypothetical protein
MRDAEFSLTPFYSPSLTLLERGNNSIKKFSDRPSLLKKRGDGGDQKKANSAKPRRGLMFTLLNVSLFNRVNSHQR